MRLLRHIFLLLMITIFSTVLRSQSQNNNESEKITYKDSIILVKSLGEYKIYKNDRQIRLKQLKKIMEPNEEAYKEIKLARSANSLGTIMQLGGAFMLGWPLGTALAGGTPHWGMVGVGAGLILVSIPIQIHSNKKLKSAVRTYNSGLNYSSVINTTRNQNQFHLTFKAIQIGVRWRF